MKRLTYESPAIEPLEVATELGFAQSTPQQNPSDWEDM